MKKAENLSISIDDIKPEDRKNGYPLHVPRWYTKLFEMIPGVFTWTLLFFPIIAALFDITEILALYVSFLTIYWSWRGIKFALGVIIGYQRMKSDMATDWVKKIEKLNSPEFKNLKYVAVLPFYKEGLDVIRPSVDAWSKSDIGAEKITLVFGLEEKASEEGIQKVEQLKKEYGNKFREILYFVHPFGIEGEVTGVKGGNINWATRSFVDMIKKRGEKVDEYLLITNDIDLRPHPKYLSAITYKYLTTENNKRKFFASAVHTFENNIWRVPVLVRVHSMALTLVVLHVFAIKPERRDTWSAYVLNLQTVVDAKYWDPEVGIDDTPFYWNAQIRFAGDFTGVPVFIPTYNDAVENETMVKTYKALYKQQLRWGWGILTFPLTFAGLYKNKQISLMKKIKMILHLLDNQLIFLTVIYMITFALPIAGLFSSEYSYSSISHNLPRIMSYILTGLMLLNIPVLIIRRKLHKIPKGWNILRHLWDIVETFLLTVNMLTFGFIPKIHAQTEMIFKSGLRKNYYATEKVEIKKNVKRYS